MEISGEEKKLYTAVAPNEGKGVGSALRKPAPDDQQKLFSKDSS